MLKQLLYGLTFVMFAVMAIAACTELTASDSAQVTMLSDPNHQATVEAAGTQALMIVELQATADSAGIMATQIGELSNQNQHLQATIAAISVANNPHNTAQQQAYANAAAPQAQQPSVQVATPMPAQDSKFGDPAAAAPVQAPATNGDADLASQTIQQINQQGQLPPTSTPPIPAATPLTSVETAPRPTQPTSPNGIYYSAATTASSVRDEDGCANNTVSTFEPTADEIYMTIVARQVKAGATFNVNWLRNSNLRFASSAWTADQDYDEICIWFSAFGPFESGNWTAEFIEDQQVVASHDFYITGESDTAETEMAGDS